MKSGRDLVIRIAKALLVYTETLVLMPFIRHRPEITDCAFNDLAGTTVQRGNGDRFLFPFGHSDAGPYRSGDTEDYTNSIWHVIPL
jgi:hypothetical protein